MNAHFGKKLAVCGFVLYALVIAGWALLTILSDLFWLDLRVLNTLLRFGDVCTLALAAAGFGVTWLAERKNIDFLCGGAIGLAALYMLLNYLGVISSITMHLPMYLPLTLARVVDFAFTGLSVVYFVVLALRVKNNNMFLSLLLVCAFIYRLLARMVFVNILIMQVGLSSTLVLLVWYACDLVCVGLCVVGAKIEA